MRFSSCFLFLFRGSLSISRGRFLASASVRSVSRLVGFGGPVPLRSGNKHLAMAFWGWLFLLLLLGWLFHLPGYFVLWGKGGVNLDDWRKEVEEDCFVVLLDIHW